MVERGGHRGLRPLGVRHRVGVGHRFPAGGDDLVDHLLGTASDQGASVRGATDVVDDDPGPRPGQEMGVGPAETGAAEPTDRRSA